MKQPKIKNLVLSGGGIKGLAILSAIEKLDDEINILSTTKTIIGSSIGAYIAVFLGIGLNVKKIKIVFENIKLNDLQNFDMKLFISKYGFDEGNKFISLIKAIIQTQNIDPCLTFKDLEKISKYNIIVVGSNITTSQPIYFSAKDTPDFSVCQALRISGGYPFAFTPIEIDGNLYADGSILYPIATDIIPKNEKNKTLGIVCHRNNINNDTSNVSKYIIGIIYCIVSSLTLQLIKNLKHCIVLSSKVEALDFDLSEEQKTDLCNLGHEKAQEWLDKFKT